MIYLYLLFFLLNPALAFAIKFDKKIEETIFLSIIGKILILFLTGIIFNFTIGFYLILFLNIPLLIYNVYNIIQRKEILRKNFLTSGLLIFIAAYIFFIWVTYGRMAITWDEFSHWALNVKSMFYTNGFDFSDSSFVMAKSYLSGTSIFQYFVLKLNGEFVEHLLYFAFNITLFSMLIPVFKGFKSIKNISIYFLLLILLAFPLIFYNTYYITLYVDEALAIAFAYTLFMYFSNRDEGFSLFNFISIASGLLMLIFIKDFGLILALIACFIIVFDNAFIKNKFKFKSMIKNNYKAVLTIIPAISVLILWMLTVRSNGLSATPAGTGGVLPNILNFFGGNLTEFQIEVNQLFNSALFNRILTLSPTIIPVTYVVSLILMMIITYCLAEKSENNNEKIAYKTMMFWIIIGAIGYAFLLLISYITIFSEWEAVRLASYERYMSSFAMGGILLVLLLLIYKYSQSLKDFGKFILIIGISMLFFAKWDVIYFTSMAARERASKTIEIRTAYKDAEKYVKEFVGDNERIYILSIHDSGFHYFVLRYHFIPLQSSSSKGWSIGTPFGENDIWTKNVEVEEWAATLKENYDYVYILHVNDYFIEIYGSLFENAEMIENNTLFRIEKEDPIRLVLVK